MGPWEDSIPDTPSLQLPGLCLLTASASNAGDSEAPSEKSMAPHSSTLTWRIPWTEEPGRLQSMGSRRVGHD